MSSIVQSGYDWQTPDPRFTLPEWYALYTVPRHEKRVAEHCGQRLIEFFLPLYQTPRRWKDGSRVTLELPLFAGYLFVHLARNERVRALELPGALWIVSRGREPAPLSDFEIESLRNGLQGRKVEPHPWLTVGERARIVRGPLAGMEGVLVRKKNNLRVVLSLDQIMQSIAVEVDPEDLEPVSPVPHRISPLPSVAIA